MPFAEQNELWSALQVAYHPSVLYKVKMAVFATAAGVGAPPVREQILRLAPLPEGSTVELYSQANALRYAIAMCSKASRILLKP